jgi:hypothetical protein
MTMRTVFGAAGVVAAVAAVLAVAAGSGPAAAQEPEAAAEARAEEAGDRLGAAIESAVREGGPLFTAEERAVIERACGYPAGSWDGYEASMSDDEFRCTNGRRVRSAEVRAVMEAAGPRIGARVSRAMANPEIRAAIGEVAREAQAAALAAIDEAEIAREAAEAAGEATREALEEARVAIEQAREAQRESSEETRRARRR